MIFAFKYNEYTHVCKYTVLEVGYIFKNMLSRGQYVVLGSTGWGWVLVYQ